FCLAHITAPSLLSTHPPASPKSRAAPSRCSAPHCEIPVARTSPPGTCSPSPAAPGFSLSDHVTNTPARDSPRTVPLRSPRSRSRIFPKVFAFVTGVGPNPCKTPHVDCPLPHDAPKPSSGHLGSLRGVFRDAKDGRRRRERSEGALAAMPEIQQRHAN